MLKVAINLIKSNGNKLKKQIKKLSQEMNSASAVEQWQPPMTVRISEFLDDLQERLLAKDASRLQLRGG
jgi:hypothetical protein